VDLLETPFHILNATPRDSRHRIMELAEERALVADSEAIDRARAVLTNPRQRISAETAWLLGLGPRRVREAIERLEHDPSLLKEFETPDYLTRCNILAAAIRRLDDSSPQSLSDWLLRLAIAFELIDLEAVRAFLNEERAVSGFPEVQDGTLIDSAVQERRKHFCTVMLGALDRLPTKTLIEVLTQIVDHATEEGMRHGPILLDDLVDAYAGEALTFLTNEAENIGTLLDKLRDGADSGATADALDPVVDYLIDVTKNWDTVAQPIQVSMRGRGLRHEPSFEVAAEIRGAAVHLVNAHGHVETARRMTNLLSEAFAEVDEVAERSEEDAAALDQIAEDRQRLLKGAEEHAEHWRSEITYQVDVGSWFTDTFSISPDGIRWKMRHWKLEDITRLRWGGTAHSVNGIPTGTTYHIYFSADYGSGTLTTKSKEIYENIVERLWKAVGVRILTDFLKGLREGQTYRFGTALVRDTGVEIERKQLFSRGERVLYPWAELVIWNAPGAFCIGRKDDRKYSVSLAYQDLDNVHLLEAAIRMFWKRGGTRLSAVLSG
jgi:hypothetical protein